MYTSCYQSPLGEIVLTADNQGLTSLSFLAASQSHNNKTSKEFTNTNETVFTKVKQQLDEYFNLQRQHFTLALAPQGTVFQQKVWQALQLINHGETQSYAWLAEKIGNEKAVRAVGLANGANPIPLIIPCHRVIGSNGKLTGYAGGLALKARLLMHEGAEFKP